jgi:hypothetical protein
LARGLIKLDSLYSETTAEGIEHLVVDIEPGSGKFEGKVIGFIGFGKMLLSGVLSDAAK